MILWNLVVWFSPMSMTKAGGSSAKSCPKLGEGRLIDLRCRVHDFEGNSCSQYKANWSRRAPYVAGCELSYHVLHCSGVHVNGKEKAIFKRLGRCATWSFMQDVVNMESKVQNLPSLEMRWAVQCRTVRVVCRRPFVHKICGWHMGSEWGWIVCQQELLQTSFLVSCWGTNLHNVQTSTSQECCFCCLQQQWTPGKLEGTFLSKPADSLALSLSTVSDGEDSIFALLSDRWAMKKTLVG